MAKVMTQFGHNYNFVSREVMYHWFNKHLKFGLTEPILEEDFQPLTIGELTVWNDKHPKPPSGPDYERSLTRPSPPRATSRSSRYGPTIRRRWPSFARCVDEEREHALGDDGRDRRPRARPERDEDAAEREHEDAARRRSPR